MIGTFFKLVFSFILGLLFILFVVIFISLAGTLFGSGILSSYIFSSSSQQSFFVPAVVIILGVPVIGLFLLMIRIWGRMKKRFPAYVLSLFFIWVLGLGILLWLTLDVKNDFKTRFSDTEEITLIQPAQKLILKNPVFLGQESAWDNFLIRFSTLNQYVRISDDSLSLQAVRVSVSESPDSVFHLLVTKSSNGRTAEMAEELASSFSYYLKQEDSVLVIPRMISIPRGRPFRNQHLRVKILVPKGKELERDETVEQPEREPFNIKENQRITVFNRVNNRIFMNARALI